MILIELHYYFILLILISIEYNYKLHGFLNRRMLFFKWKKKT